MILQCIFQKEMFHYASVSIVFTIKCHLLSDRNGRLRRNQTDKSADIAACPPTLTHLQLKLTIAVMMQPLTVLIKLVDMLSNGKLN